MPERAIVTCHYGCGTTNADPTALRPYGPGGAMVCHPCAMATPERAAIAAAAFEAIVQAAAAMSPHGAATMAADGIHPYVGDTDG